MGSQGDLKTLRLLEKEDQVIAQAAWLAAFNGDVESFSEGYRDLMDAESFDDLDWSEEFLYHLDGAKQIYNYRQSLEEEVEDETWGFSQDLYLLMDTSKQLVEEQRYSELDELFESFEEKYGK